MSFSNYLENAFLDHLVGNAVFTAPASLHIALSTADPLDDCSGLAEPTEGSYCREGTTDADWNGASGGSVSNANDISFVEAGGSWGILSHWAVFDKESGKRGITGVNSAAAGSAYFEVAGDITDQLVVGNMISVLGSTGNDGPYTVRSGSSYSSASDTTAVNVDEAISDATADGTLMIAIHPVAGVTTGSAGAASFDVAGDLTGELEVGARLRIAGSTANDGIYTVRSGSSYSSPNTTIHVEEAVSDGTVDGNLHLLGNLLGSGALNSSKSVGPGDTALMSAGTVSISLD